MIIKGNKKLLSQIEEMLKSGRFFHACIITGAHGTGKKTLAGFLASAAVCIGDQPPCGHCEGCKKAEKHIHPDIERVKRERGEITIEQVRSLRASLYTRANEAPRRIAIIEEADRMNRSAQNAILTVLEEPPSDVLLIFVSENEYELLPTIRSRCVTLRMTPLPASVISAELRSADASITSDVADEIARRAGGSLGLAKELVGSLQKNSVTTSIIRALMSKKPINVIRAVLALEGMKREDIAPIINDLRYAFAGAAALKIRKGEYYPSEEEMLLYNVMDKKKLLRLSDGCARIAEYCDANVGTGHITGALIQELTN